MTKIKQTNIEKYGVENPLKNEKVKEKKWHSKPSARLADLTY